LISLGRLLKKNALFSDKKQRKREQFGLSVYIFVMYWKWPFLLSSIVELNGTLMEETSQLQKYRSECRFDTD